MILGAEDKSIGRGRKHGLWLNLQSNEERRVKKQIYTCQIVISITKGN